MINQAIQQLGQPKFQRRLISIITNSLNHLLLPVFNPLIALLVIRLSTIEMWGSFVNVMIIVHFGVNIISWGNKEFLLRAFSRTPSNISSIWLNSLSARLLIFGLFSIAIILWGFSPVRWGLVILWAFSLAVEQSFDVFILYKKDFKFELGVELSAMALLCTLIFLTSDRINVEILIFSFAAVNLVKTAFYVLKYRNYFGRIHLNEGHKTGLGIQHYLLAAFPFFLLGFSGMLQSRIDLYSASYFFQERDVAQYQVFSNLLIYLQALANFIMLPFVKNIYRLQHATIQKLSRKLFVFGLVILLPGLGIVNFMLSSFYEIRLPLQFFFWGGLFVLPIYYYLPIIYSLYRSNQQNTVLFVNFGGALATLALNFIFFPVYGLVGAVISIALVRWLILFVYTRLGNQLLEHVDEPG